MKKCIGVKDREQTGSENETKTQSFFTPKPLLGEEKIKFGVSRTPMEIGQMIKKKLKRNFAITFSSYLLPPGQATISFKKPLKECSQS